mmetsp:Transcript_26474/g.45173  ORF Transcript_26474/g.45173 Transcript_26474/m.45173 type:complete len:209 (-) Transcript_26474:299-925(-)
MSSCCSQLIDAEIKNLRPNAVIDALSRHRWDNSCLFIHFTPFSHTLSSNHYFIKVSNFIAIMDAEKVAELRKKRTFKKFTFRGIELDALLDLTNDELMDLVTARARRRMSRGLKRKPMALIKRLRQAKKEAPSGEKPRGIKTHLRNMIIVPEMIGSIVGIYNGKMFCGVEMKPEMVGMYLGEFAITYKPVRHGRPGVSAAHQTRFIPL